MKYKCIFKITILFCIVLINSATIPDENEFFNTLIVKSYNYNQAYPSERVFIQTDRTCYRAGDILWFKAFIENTLEKKQLSSDLYIEIYDQCENRMGYVRYPVKNNSVDSYYVLSKNLDAGKYCLYAYTSQIKNKANRLLFKKEILIGNKIENKIIVDLKYNKPYFLPGEDGTADLTLKLNDNILLPDANITYTINSGMKKITNGSLRTDHTGYSKISFTIPSETENEILSMEIKININKSEEVFVNEIPLIKKEIHLNLFPEGGTIVEGMSGRIAFSATDNFGRPVEVKGYVADSLDRKVAEFESIYKGMGIFDFSPSSDMKYKTVITYPVAGELHYPFPKIRKEGIQIIFRGIKNNEALFAVRNSNPAKIIDTEWIGEKDNKIYYASKVQLMNYKLVKVPLNNMPTGVLKFTVFTDKKPEVTRCIYLPERHDSNIFSVSINPSICNRRGKLQLTVSDPGESGLQIAAIKVTKADCHQKYYSPVINYFDFCASLKEFNSVYLEGELTSEIYDLICLTHDMYSLPFNEIISLEQKEIPMVNNSDGLTGIISDKKGNLLSNVKMKATDLQGLNSYECSSDIDGNFSFSFNDDIVKINELEIKAPGRTDYQIKIYDPVSELNKSNHGINQDNWSEKVQLNLIKYHNPDFIFTGKFNKMNRKTTEYEFDKGYDYKTLSTYTSMLDVIKTIRPFELVNNQIVFPGQHNSISAQNGALIILDGTNLGSRIEILNSISPKDVIDINISTSPSDILRYSGLNNVGIIEIKTIKKELPGSLESDDTQKYNHKNDIRKDYKFQVPDYSTFSGTEFDDRITLFWSTDFYNQSEIMLDRKFFASDIPGKYECEVILQNTEGNFLVKKTDFKVGE